MKHKNNLLSLTAAALSIACLSACNKAQQSNAEQQQESTQTAEQQQSPTAAPDMAAAAAPAPTTGEFCCPPNNEDYAKMSELGQKIASKLPKDKWPGGFDFSDLHLRNEDAPNIFEYTLDDDAASTTYTLMLLPRCDNKILVLHLECNCFDNCDTETHAYLYDPKTEAISETEDPIKIKKNEFNDPVLSASLSDSDIKELNYNENSSVGYFALRTKVVSASVEGWDERTQYLPNALFTWDGNKFVFSGNEYYIYGTNIGEFRVSETMPMEVKGLSIVETAPMHNWAKTYSINDTKGNTLMLATVPDDGRLEELVVLSPTYVWDNIQVGKPIMEYFDGLQRDPYDPQFRARKYGDRVYIEGINYDYENSAIILDMEDLEEPLNVEEGYATQNYRIKKDATIKGYMICLSVG